MTKSKHNHCPKTLSGEHIWDVVESGRKEFTGTAGYYITFYPKCSACGVVDDSRSAAVDSGVHREGTENEAYRQLYGEENHDQE